MENRVLRVALAGILVLALAAGLLYHEARRAEASRLSVALAGHVIYLDPGHGGPDAGASGHGVEEEDVVLAIAAHLRRYLHAAGAYALLTRETDQDLSEMSNSRWSARKTRDLHERVRRINASPAEILISIHANAIGSPRWYGGQTFYRPEAGREAARLARLVQEELVAVTGQTTRAPNDDIHQFILEQARMPAITVEVGFLSNPREARLLATEAYQKKVAWAIFLGIARYFAEMEMSASASLTEP